MNDPHVEVLNYTLVPLDDRDDFSQAASWEGDLGDFRCRLANERLEARPGEHYPDAESAQRVLDSHLRAWQLWSELQDALRIRFKFDSAKMVDRQPSPGSVTVHAQLAEAGVAANDASVRVGHSSYPMPSPVSLRISPHVEELLGWVRDLREGHQRMLVIAYLVHSSLEYEYGGVKGAARALNVSVNVFTTLGRLAHKNDPSERRKVWGTPDDPLTETERNWILAVVPRLARQVAELAAGSVPTRLDLGDLPRLQPGCPG